MKHFIVFLSFFTFFSQTIYAAQSTNQKDLEQSMLVSVARRNINDFLATVEQLRALGVDPASYKTSTGKNLIHVLIGITQKPDDKHSLEMLKVLLAEDILPFEKDETGT